jgi:hypothetical protein
MPFKEINPEWDSVRNGLFTMLRQGKLKGRAARIRKILAQTHKELEAV